MLIPRLLIAGTHSGAGKTTLATGLMAALVSRGLQVQGFKVGPDYIDPGYHSLATGRPPRNLDVWLQGEERIAALFANSAQGTDVVVVEGVMGLFDGIRNTRGQGSSAHIAKLIQIPVVLVIDGKGQARSAAALVQGFAAFDPAVNLAGVIINRVSSPAHYQGLKAAIEEEAGLPVLGALPLDKGLSVSERHLGLVPAVERRRAGQDNQAYLARLGQLISDNLDLDRLLALAQAAPPLAATGTGHAESGSAKATIAVARDEAFHFYYQDALETLQSQGARLVEFSPLYDEKLPAETDGLYIGGGFPEEFVMELACNICMMNSIRRFCSAGRPIYAECGGLMYLCERIIDRYGQTRAGVGLVPAVTRITDRLAGLGYRTGRLLQPTVLGETGTQVQGHEFHYSVVEYRQSAPAYELTTAVGEDRGQEGYARANLLASYLHLNFAGQPQLAAAFIERCAAAKGGRA